MERQHFPMRMRGRKCTTSGGRIPHGLRQKVESAGRRLSRGRKIPHIRAGPWPYRRPEPTRGRGPGVRAGTAGTSVPARGARESTGTPRRPPVRS